MKIRCLSMALALTMLLSLLPVSALAEGEGVAINAENFPDASFEEYVRQQFDMDNNGSLSAEEIEEARQIVVSDKGISSLEGIEYFTSLKILSCTNNELTQLAGLPDSITSIDCQQNQIKSIDKLPAGLTTLNCGFNQLTTLPALPAGLNSLVCYRNELTSLPALPEGLTELNCCFNQLTTLPVLPQSLTELDCGNNRLVSLPALPEGLAELYCDSNELASLPALPQSLSVLCCADNKLETIALNPNANYTEIQASNNRLPDKSAVTGQDIAWSDAEDSRFVFGKQDVDVVAIDEEHFPDAAFRKYVSERHDTDGNGVLSAFEIEESWYITIDPAYNVSSLEGVKYFMSAELLNCSQCGLTELPELPGSLKELDCFFNELTSLPTLPDGLITLDCDNNRLTELPALPESLKELNCYANELTSLPALPDGLITLYFSNNELTELPTLPDGLITLGCSGNLISEIPALPATLTRIEFGYNPLNDPNKVFALLNDDFTHVSCDGLGLTALPELPKSLVSLLCSGNALTSLPVLPDGMTTLVCYDNRLTSLPELPATMVVIWCFRNQLTELPALPDPMQILYCQQNQLTALPELPEKLYRLDCSDNELTEVRLNAAAEYEYINVSSNLLADKSAVSGQNIVWDEQSFIFGEQTDPTPPHVHSYTDVVTAPTCTEKGYTTHTCACGESFVDSYVDAKGHDTEIKNAKDATCTEKGYTGDEVCTVCSETVKAGSEIGAKGHDTEIKNAKAATATEKGYTGDEVCKVCGVTVKTGEVIPELGEEHVHSYTDVVTAPTCTEKGYTTHTCACGESFVDSYVNALGHDTEIKNAKDATCTEKGYTGDEVCKVCGETVKTGSEIGALGHKYENGVCVRCGEADPNADTPTENPFTDVSSEKYFYAPVMWAVNHEPQITGGYTDGTFRPQNTCTRAQIVTFIWRAKGCPEPTGTSCTFTDVAPGAYYYKAVLWAVENGITGGYDAQTFGSNDTVTRAQAMTFLWRAAGKPAAPAGTVNTFTDVSPTSYYYEAVLWAVANGVTGGYNETTFGSNDGCTRGQIVTFLYRNMK